MRRLIFLLILLPFLIGGGVGAYLYLWRNDPVEEAPPPSPALPVLLFTNVAPITISMIGPDRAEQFVTFRIVLEVANAAAQERIQSMQPRLQNALTETLYASLSDPNIQTGAVIDLPRLKRRLLAACERTVGRGNVAQVLIHGIVQRPV